MIEDFNEVLMKRLFNGKGFMIEYLLDKFDLSGWMELLQHPFRMSELKLFCNLETSC